MEPGETVLWYISMTQGSSVDDDDDDDSEDEVYNDYNDEDIDDHAIYSTVYHT